MSWIALRTLTGDFVKDLGMIFGVVFSTWLIAQQSSVFVGLVDRAETSLRDVRDADIWIMDPRIEAVDSATWRTREFSVFPGSGCSPHHGRAGGVEVLEFAASVLTRRPS